MANFWGINIDPTKWHVNAGTIAGCCLAWGVLSGHQVTPDQIHQVTANVTGNLNAASEGVKQIAEMYRGFDTNVAQAIGLGKDGLVLGFVYKLIMNHFSTHVDLSKIKQSIPEDQQTQAK